MNDDRHNHEMMRRLEGVWCRRRRFVNIRGACHLLLWTLFLLAADFLIDWIFRLSGSARLWLLGANAAVLAVVGFRKWWRHCRSYDPVVAALEVERLYPQLGSLLVSYVQFHDKPPANHDASPALVEAMLQQAESQTRALPFHDTVRFATLWRLYLSGFLACGVATGIVALYPGFARAFATRMLNPWSGHWYPTRTILNETSGDLVVQAGRTVSLRALVSGELPDEGTLRIQAAGGHSDTIRLSSAGPRDDGRREFVYRLDAAHQDFSYSFHLGDARSPVHRVRVVAAPRTQVRVNVTLPEYTGLKPQDVAMLGFEVLEGSKIEWTLAADRPLAEVRMIPDPGTTTPASLSNDRRTGILTLTPANSFSYGFQWTDAENGFTYPPEVRYSVRVVPDHPPTVVLRSPVTDEKATVWKVADLAFTARDDFGLASARLAYTVLHGPGDTKGDAEKSEEIVAFPAGCRESAENRKWRIQDSIPSLKPGDIVRYAVQVFDRKPPPAGPGVARSQTCQVTIVSQEEYVQIAMERRQRLLARIKTLHGEELTADESVKTLLRKTEDAKDEQPNK